MDYTYHTLSNYLMVSSVCMYMHFFEIGSVLYLIPSNCLVLFL